MTSVMSSRPPHASIQKLLLLPTTREVTKRFFAPLPVKAALSFEAIPPAAPPAAAPVDAASVSAPLVVESVDVLYLRG